MDTVLFASAMRDSLGLFLASWLGRSSLGALNCWSCLHCGSVGCRTGLGEVQLIGRFENPGGVYWRCRQLLNDDESLTREGEKEGKKAETRCTRPIMFPRRDGM